LTQLLVLGLNFGNINSWHEGKLSFTELLVKSGIQIPSSYQK